MTSYVPEQVSNNCGNPLYRAGTELKSIRRTQREGATNDCSSSKFLQSGSLDIWRQIRRGNSMCHQSQNSISQAQTAIQENDMRSVIAQEFLKSFPLKDGDVKEVKDIFRKINKDKKFA